MKRKVIGVVYSIFIINLRYFGFVFSLGLHLYGKNVPCQCSAELTKATFRRGTREISPLRGKEQPRKGSEIPLTRKLRLPKKLA